MPIEEPDQNLFLLNELQKGQERAFDYIFRKYYKALCAQANAYVKDLDKSQSLVQECFIKLWENRKNADTINNLSAYLSFMVRNRCIDYIRKTKSSESLDSLQESTETLSDTEQTVLLHDFEEKLVRALSSLPERSRIAFEYSRFENFTYKEIAVKMKISVKAVEALLSRALKILRAELKDYLPLLILLLKVT